MHPQVQQQRSGSPTAQLELNLKQFAPAFIVLLIGYSLSFVLFLLERKARKVTPIDGSSF
jgi:hypothetical protein